MKILFLSYLAQFGGAERQTVFLANCMAEQGHDVTLISVKYDNTCYKVSSKVKYIFLPDETRGIWRLSIRFFRLKSIVASIHPDITISFWLFLACLAVMMGKRRTGKVIFSERCDPEQEWAFKGWIGLFITKVFLPRIDGFVFQIGGARNFFSDSIQQKSVIIPNPVFVKRSDYPVVKERRKAIVNVGRLHKQKNQRLLIDAFAQIIRSFPEYILEIYGDGKLRDDLQLQINSKGLQDCVFLKGTSRQLHDLIYDAALFVSSSDYEGLPNSLIEALALGIPCISTDFSPGGAQELIKNGENGVIVPCGNTKRLAEAMAVILSDKGRAEAYAEKAMCDVQRFTPKIILGKWNSFLKNMIERA